MTTPRIPRPLLRWHGGKWKIAQWVLQHFPHHRVYVEPYGGAASILLQKPRAPTEVYNDLDDGLQNLFAVLRDPELALRLRELCELTPFSRREFDLSYTEGDTPVERARRLVVRSFFGYGSKSCTSATRNGFRSRRAGSASPAVDWGNYPPTLAAVAQRMQGVVVEHRPALDVIRGYDSRDGLIYADPPYVHATRVLKHGKYHHEMTDGDHEELSRTLHACTSAVIVSGYPCELYRDCYSRWRMETKNTFADKSSPRVECLWLSPLADSLLKENAKKKA